MSQANIQPSNPNPPSQTLNLSDLSQLDLSGLSTEQINALKIKQAECMIDLQRKKTEMGLDVCALDSTLASFNNHAEKANRDGHSATFQHSQSSSLGRTEIMIGNTEKAASGKLSLSASGQSGRALFMGVIIVLGLIIIALLLGR